MEVARMPNHVFQNSQALLRSFFRSLNSCRSSIYAAIAIAAISLFLSTCTESLPPYEPPKQLFEGHLEPLYSLKANENALHVYFRIRNIYVETLEGAPSFKGQVQFVLLRNPNVTKTLNLTSENINFARNYNPALGRLTIDPGDSIVFDVSWNLAEQPLLDDSGRDLALSGLRVRTDPECASRQTSDPEDFAVQGSVEVFAWASPVVAKQVIFRWCWISAWIHPKYCPPVGSPCNMIISGGN
jgi:hypothetical protein